ncbi:MAG: helix-turn-helix domain-containing protein [Firmicutes bacterium]|nr:helix-turn-helix domain-containing protein [Bacillota bacterium]
MTKKEFGLRLAKARQEKNISAYELSLRIGKSTGYMHLLETGKVNVSVDILFKICKELKIDPKELF